MPLFDRAFHVAAAAYRRLYLPKVDSIAAIRERIPGWAATRDEIRQSGTDSLEHFGNGYVREGGLSLQQNPDEFASICALLEEAGPLPAYIEVGSASGGACLFLFRKLGFEIVLSLDDGKHPRASEQPSNFSEILVLRQFVGDSHSSNAAQFLAQHLDKPADVAFVDGDHSYQGVVKDIELVYRVLRPGGFLVLHDTVASAGVERAWLRCLRDPRLRPVAEYIGSERPLGIGVAAVVA